MGNIKDTQYFQAVQDKKIEVSDVLEQVYIALTEKGYNPVNQIVGYIMSGAVSYTHLPPFTGLPSMCSVP